ncbi:MAG: hypothetical protein KGM47_01995 [Acidobacteriota bacterium]|nr:hypothetical protein [Acidobacteriota bacterium]
MMTSKIPTHDSSLETKTVSELIRDGSAPPVIRRKGARAELPLDLNGKLEVLALLTEDPAEEIRNAAIHTLTTWDADEMHSVLADPKAPSALLEWAARNLAEGHGLEALLQNPAISAGAESQILVRMAADAGAATNPDSVPASTEPDALSPGRETVQQRLGRATVAQKIKRALLGNQEERLILVRDPNKIVARAVLQSPKLTESEIEAFASMRNVGDEVLRLIGVNRGFLKNYSVLRALINNPRAPLDIMLPMISRLNERDIKSLSTNKNIADALRTAAAKIVMSRQSSRTSAFLHKH